MAPRKKAQKKMKETIFNIIWSAILAWLMTKGAVLLDARFDISEMYCIPDIIDFLHGFDFSVKMVFFILMTAFLALTGIGKLLGNFLLTIIGFIIWGGIIALILFVVYHLMIWIAGTL